MTTLFAADDKAVLLDSKKRRYLIDLADDGEFHSHAGFVRHSDIIGQAEGCRVRSTKNGEYVVLRPTLEDFVIEMPRGAQVIYPKDLAPICMLADIGPGMRVFESGIGSGALSTTMLRYGAEIVGYEIREDFANRARTNVRGFLGEVRARALRGAHREQLRRASTRRTVRSTGSCSTFPSRGRSYRTPRRCSARAESCSRTRRRSRRPRRCARRSRASGSTVARSRCCIGMARRGQAVRPIIGWSRTPAS